MKVYILLMILLFILIVSILYITHKKERYGIDISDVLDFLRPEPDYTSEFKQTGETDNLDQVLNDMIATQPDINSQIISDAMANVVSNANIIPEPENKTKLTSSEINQICGSIFNSFSNVSLQQLIATNDDIRYLFKPDGLGCSFQITSWYKIIPQNTYYCVSNGDFIFSIKDGRIQKCNNILVEVPSWTEVDKTTQSTDVKPILTETPVVTNPLSINKNKLGFVTTNLNNLFAYYADINAIEMHRTLPNDVLQTSYDTTQSSGIKSISFTNAYCVILDTSGKMFYTDDTNTFKDTIRVSPSIINSYSRQQGTSLGLYGKVSREHIGIADDSSMDSVGRRLVKNNWSKVYVHDLGIVFAIDNNNKCYRCDDISTQNSGILPVLFKGILQNVSCIAFKGSTEQLAVCFTNQTIRIYPSFNDLNVFTDTPAFSNDGFGSYNIVSMCFFKDFLVCSDSVRKCLLCVLPMVDYMKTITPINNASYTKEATCNLIKKHYSKLDPSLQITSNLLNCAATPLQLSTNTGTVNSLLNQSTLTGECIDGMGVRYGKVGIKDCLTYNRYDNGYLDFTVVYSKGSFGNVDIGETITNTLFRNSNVFKRECVNCVGSHKEIYYKRITPIPSTFSIYNQFNNWTSTNNILNKDFKLYSSWNDLINDTNSWNACNYDDPNIGFPRDCGMGSLIGDQWNSLSRGGQQNIRYSIMNNQKVGIINPMSNTASLRQTIWKVGEIDTTDGNTYYLPIRLNNGKVECIATNGVDCYWTTKSDALKWAKNPPSNLNPRVEPATFYRDDDTGWPAQAYRQLINPERIQTQKIAALQNTVTSQYNQIKPQYNTLTNQIVFTKSQLQSYLSMNSCQSDVNGGLCSSNELYSSDGKYWMTLQNDGNLCVYNYSSAGVTVGQWCSSSANIGTAPYRLYMENDGNLVIYDSTKKAIWKSGTSLGSSVSSAPFKLVMQTDGNLVIYDKYNVYLWSRIGGKNPNYSFAPCSGNEYKDSNGYCILCPSDQIPNSTRTGCTTLVTIGGNDVVSTNDVIAPTATPLGKAGSPCTDNSSCENGLVCEAKTNSLYKSFASLYNLPTNIISNDLICKDKSVPKGGSCNGGNLRAQWKIANSFKLCGGTYDICCPIGKAECDRGEYNPANGDGVCGDERAAY